MTAQAIAPPHMRKPAQPNTILPAPLPSQRPAGPNPAKRLPQIQSIAANGQYATGTGAVGRSVGRGITAAIADACASGAEMDSIRRRCAGSGTELLRSGAGLGFGGGGGAPFFAIFSKLFDHDNTDGPLATPGNGTVHDWSGGLAAVG